jgi:predicted HicB family RNase H-like nuclease
VEIRLAGDDVELSYVPDPDQPGPVTDADAELSARITLRVSEGLKARVEARAADEGVSVNSYIVRTLERGASTTQNRSSRGGTRLRGYGTA